MSLRVYIYLLLVLILMGCISWAVVSRLSTSSTPIACTEEALLCPDGTVVSRSGPSCSFSPCGSKSPLTGTLEETRAIPRLLVASPKISGQDAATYAIPLLFTTSVGAGLAGSKVRIFGEFSEGNTYRVDRIEAVPSTDPTHEVTSGTIGVGETVFINGVKITLNDIVSDNRCPAEVQCIVAGAVTANVTLLSDTDIETFDMRSDAAPYAFDSYEVAIIHISPSPSIGDKPDQKAYRLMFKVVPLRDEL